jgi:RNase adapter protein RapZ
MQIILISGLSGSGKSVAIKVLEDARFYCIDNLPAKFLPAVAQHLHESGEQQVAINIDARSGDTLDDLPKAIADVREQGVDVRILFLEANTENLVKRFSETRRHHPLMENGRTLTEAIVLEQTKLAAIAELAHRIDTSDISPNTLRGWIKDFVALDESRLTLYFQSFGFKHGIPHDADIVFDARMLPNPFYDPLLRPLTGQDDAVVEFLDHLPAAQDLLNDIEGFLSRWLPSFAHDNRSSMTVAIGCTGGQHRSVYLVEKLAERFRGKQQVLVRHRNLWRLPNREPAAT